MIDLAHEEVLAFLALLAFGNVLCGADEAHGLSLRPGTLEIGKSMILHPADLAVSPPDPVLDREGLRIDGIKSRRDSRPNPLNVVRMHPPEDLFEHHLLLRNIEIENLVSARVARACAAERIVLPRAEAGCIEGKLQTIFARLQRLPRLLALDCKAHPGSEDHQEKCHQRKQHESQQFTRPLGLTT